MTATVEVEGQQLILCNGATPPPFHYDVPTLRRRSSRFRPLDPLDP